MFTTATLPKIVQRTAGSKIFPLAARAPFFVVQTQNPLYRQPNSVVGRLRQHADFACGLVLLYALAGALSDMQFKHPHALTCWPTVRLDHKTLEMVYVIETDLAITPEASDYDERAFADFVEAARTYLKENPHYDSVRIERVPTG
jgi:hypothetical protein